MKRYNFLFPVFLLMLFDIPGTLADHQAMIQDAWIADAPPVAKIRAGYLILHNPGDHETRIQSFSSPAFKRIELHKTIVKDNMVRMEEIKMLIIKPGQKIEFKPGGYHLMLFNPQRKLNNGDKVTIKLKLKDNMTTSFTAVVRKRGNGKHMMMDHKHHKCGGK